MVEQRIKELALKIGNTLVDEVEVDIIEDTLRQCSLEQKTIDDERHEAELKAYANDIAEDVRKSTIEKVLKEFCCVCMRENDRSCICLDSSKCRLYLDFKRAIEK